MRLIARTINVTINGLHFISEYMNKTLFYTFRTNKDLDFFKRSEDFFVFGFLKKDIVKFQNIIEKSRPRFVLGIAKIRGRSRAESKTVTRFGANGVINKNGKDSYNLEIVSGTFFRTSKVPSTSFCNWTMYKIKEYVDASHINACVSFVHYNSVDRDTLLALCRQLTR